MPQRRAPSAPAAREAMHMPAHVERSLGVTCARPAGCARSRAAAGPGSRLKSRGKAAKRNLKGGQGCGRHSPPGQRARAAPAASKAIRMPPHLERSCGVTRARPARRALPRAAAGPALVLKSRRKAAKRNRKEGRDVAATRLCCRSTPPALRRQRARPPTCLLISSAAAAGDAPRRHSAHYRELRNRPTFPEKRQHQKRKAQVEWRSGYSHNSSHKRPMAMGVHRKLCKAQILHTQCKVKRRAWSDLLLMPS